MIDKLANSCVITSGAFTCITGSSSDVVHYIIYFSSAHFRDVGAFWFKNCKGSSEAFYCVTADVPQQMRRSECEKPL